MLKKVGKKSSSRTEARVALVASQYNARYVNAMLREARRELEQGRGVKLEVVRVPGAYEIPSVVARLAARTSNRPEAIICLGVILRGETTHAQHIGEAVSMALVQLQVQHALPIIHEVLLLENEAQARVRCLGRTHNRGREAAQSALAMVNVMRRI
jgi:6,7-dimethyl-8-ribityllumazine synthase